MRLWRRMQTGIETNKALRERRLSFWLVLLVLVIVFLGAVRWRLRDMPLERDEGEYAYAGQLMLQGVPPYTLAYNMKLPGIYAAYAAVMAAFGETPAGIHLGLLLVNASTTILLFFLTARLFGGRTGWIAGCSYALLSTSASVMGFEAHATNFVVLPALPGILLLLHAMEAERGWVIFLSGLFLGVAFLMKQHGMFFVLFGFVWLAWNAGDLRLVVKRWTELGVGAILPYAVTCALMWRAGVFRQFWFWTFEYAGEYSKMGLRRAIRAFGESSQSVVAPSLLIWILAAVGLTAIFWNVAARRQSRFLILFPVCSFLAICPGAYFRPHYFILVLPAVAILAGVGLCSLAELWGKRSAIIALIVLIFCVAISVYRQRKEYFFLSPADVVREIYGDNAFIPAVAAADYVREHSPEDAKIAVLGSEPEIYFYAHRHSATGYLYMYSLIVHHKYTARMRDEMMQELEANRPLYVVYVDVWDDWGGREGGPQLEEFLPRLREFMDRSYEEVSAIGEQPREAGGYQPRSVTMIHVLRRRDGV